MDPVKLHLIGQQRLYKVVAQTRYKQVDVIVRAPSREAAAFIAVPMMQRKIKYAIVRRIRVYVQHEDKQ